MLNHGPQQRGRQPKALKKSDCRPKSQPPPAAYGRQNRYNRPLRRGRLRGQLSAVKGGQVVDVANQAKFRFR